MSTNLFIPRLCLTPQENGHIEAFHSLVQREVIGEHQFESHQHAEDVLATWLEFYNNRRLHSGCKYRTPRAVWDEFWRENPMSLFADNLKTVA